MECHSCRNVHSLRESVSTLAVFMLFEVTCWYLIHTTHTLFCYIFPQGLCAELMVLSLSMLSRVTKSQALSNPARQAGGGVPENLCCS